MLRNACAFHTFFLGVSQVPEPRKVWCHKLSVSHSSWLCTAFFYSTALNDSNCTTFNSGLEQGLIKKQDSNRAAFYDGLERRTILCLHDYYTLLSLFIHLASLVISQKKETQRCASFTTNLFCEMVETPFEHECLLFEPDEMTLLLFCKHPHHPDENNRLHLK